MSESKINHKSSRRRFVSGFSSMMAAAASVPAGGNLLAAQSGSRSDPKVIDEAYWTFVSKQFVLEGGLTYLNAGTTGAMPRPVLDAAARYQRMLAENPKVRHLFEYIVLPNQIRKKAAVVLGADLEETAL